MKKILFLVTLPPPMHGSNRVNQMMVKNPLLAGQFESRVLVLNYARSIEEIGRFQFVKYYRLLKYLLQLCWMLISFRPAAVYFVPCVTGGSFWRDCLFVALLKLFRKQRIFHLHGKGIAASAIGKIKTLVYRWFFADAKILLLSPALFFDIESVADKSQVSYLANGTDIDGQRPLNRDSSNPVRFIFLSNLIPTKGPETLLQACQLLVEKGFDFTAVFIGNPSKELTVQGFNTLIEKGGLARYVTYLGPKYGAEKNAELTTADVMVFPTYKDCFPLVLLEAMAFGLPVISTFEGAIPDIVADGETGFLIPDRNPQKLAEKMGLFIDNPALATELGEASYQKYQSQYTLSTFNRRAAKILGDLVSSEVEKEATDALT